MCVIEVAVDGKNVRKEGGERKKELERHKTATRPINGTFT